MEKSTFSVPHAPFEHFPRKDIVGLSASRQKNAIHKCGPKASLVQLFERSGNFGQKGQKPIGVRENFAKARERYSIFSSVDSATEYSAERSEADAAPPHVFILFKGKKKGTIFRDLLADADLPPWLHLQVQECGHYRDEDVLEALEKILPVATSTEQSIVVLLDLYAAHRSPDVIEFIETRGHIVLFHGGGCTPFTQVNDTHLRANLTRLFIKFENQLTHEARVDMHLNYRNGIPTLSRQDICHIVATAWRMINHKHVADKGYMQTGPGLPSSGPIRHDQVAADLVTVLDRIDPPVGVQEIGQRLRDDAKAFVMRGIRINGRGGNTSRCLFPSMTHSTIP